MTQTQMSLIDWLKQTNVINSRPDFIAILTSIDKLTDNDIDKSYFLGHFFKNRFSLDNLAPTDKKYLMDTLKNKNLNEYFFLKTQPKQDFPNSISYFIASIGLIVIIAGTIQLINGNFWVGIGTRYLATIVREGGYKILLGLIFLTGGLLRVRHNIKKNKLLKSLSS